MDVTNTSGERLLSTRAVRQLIGGNSADGLLSVPGLESLIRAKLIPPGFKLGRYRRWREREVLAAIAKIQKQQQA